jgi:predicted transcriptional regulator of viral defense system
VEKPDGRDIVLVMIVHRHIIASLVMADGLAVAFSAPLDHFAMTSNGPSPV